MTAPVAARHDSPLEAAALQVGDRAPDFSLTDQHGAPVVLSELLAAGRSVLLVFYPFAFTGVCTGELQVMTERIDELATEQNVVLTLSCDAMYSLRAFADQQSLPLQLLSDFWPHGEVAQAYGVFEPDRGCAVRGSFLVAADGTIAWRVVNEIPYARDVDAYVSAIADLPGR